jgi:hypothetical protein
MTHKVKFVAGYGWMASEDPEVAWHVRVIRTARLRGQLQSLFWIHQENFDIPAAAA